MTTTGEVLKPCAHCGFVDVALCRYENKMWAVECDECGASTKQHHRDDLVISAWNRRSAPKGNAGQEGYVLEEFALWVAQKYPTVRMTRETVAKCVREYKDHIAATSNKEVER